MNSLQSVVIISHDFVPLSTSSVHRVLDFVKFLPDHGWRPILLTAPPRAHHSWDDTLREEAEQLQATIVQTEGSKVKTGQTKVPARLRRRVGDGLSSMVHLIEPQAGWYKSAYQAGRRILQSESVDVIFATAPPFVNFMVARQLAQEFNLPFVVDYQDLWVDNPYHFYATPLHKASNVKHETAILKTAASVLATSRHTKEALLRRYGFLEHNDVTIVPQGFNSADFAPYTSSAAMGDKLVISYRGQFLEDRTPKYFLQALRRFLRKFPERKPHVEARFIGALHQSDLKLISKYKLEANTLVTGQVSYRDGIRHMAESHVLWLMCRHNIRALGTLFDYLGARKALLVSVPAGNIHNIAESSEAAVLTAPDDVAAIAQALDYYFELWQAKTLPCPGDEFLSQFDRNRLTAELARLLGMAMHV